MFLNIVVANKIKAHEIDFDVLGTIVLKLFKSIRKMMAIQVF